MRSFIVILVVVLFVGPFLILADQSSSTNFIIERGVVNVGGVRNSTSSGFIMQGSIGEPGTGISSSTNFIIRGGFLNFFVPAPPAPSPTPSPSTSPPSPSGPGSSGGGIGYPFRSSATGVAAIFPPTFACSPDFNLDNRIDIIDLSIILFHYSSKDTNVGCYDLNRNGVVDFPDISVLMYYWTK